MGTVALSKFISGIVGPNDATTRHAELKSLRREIDLIINLILSS